MPVLSAEAGVYVLRLPLVRILYNTLTVCALPWLSCRTNSMQMQELCTVRSSAMLALKHLEGVHNPAVQHTN
jgi:hypothetical protein